MTTFFSDFVSPKAAFVNMKSYIVYLLTVIGLVLITNVSGFMDCDQVESDEKECCKDTVRHYFKLKDMFLMKCCEDKKKCTSRMCEELAADEALKEIMKNPNGIVFRTSLGGTSYPTHPTTSSSQRATVKRCSLPLSIRK